MSKRTRTTELVAAGLVLSFLALSSTLPTSYAQVITTTSTTATTATITSSAATPTSTNNGTTTTTGNGAPSAFLGVASTTGNGVIYYQGGQLNTATVQYSDELLSLDVTKTWLISTPAWSNLTIPASGSGGPTVGGHSATMSSDLTTLYLTAPTGSSSSPFLYGYNVNARTWSTDNAPAAQAVAWSTRKQAMFLTDTIKGAIWYVGGTSPDGTDSNEIDKFQSGSWNANIGTASTSSSSSTSSDGSVAVMSKYSSGTAHILDSKIFIFGGFSSAGGARSYQSFQSLPWIDVSTATPTIGTQLTLGLVPAQRQDHCSVLTGSEKVIIFGGYDANAKSTFSDIWSLDLVTMTWVEIIPINSARPRYGHNCNLVGANMVVYGGRASGTGNSTGVGYSKDIQVYDIMTATWMDTYTPKKDTTVVSSPLPGGVGSGSSRSKKLSTGGLAGIIVGVLVVVICVAGVFVYRKRQRQIEIQEAEMEKEAYLASLGTEGDEGTSRKQRGQHRRNNPYSNSASSPRSASTRHLNSTSTSTSAPGSYGQSGIESPTAREFDHDLSYTGDTPGNVQYLMQQLPDGTIAVQPVYLDHQPLQLQRSPNMIYSETSSLGGFLGSPTVANFAGGVGMSGSMSPSAAYFAPPPPVHNNGVASSPLSPGYVLPPSNEAGGGASPMLDPFASPVLTQSQAQWLQSSPSSPRSQSRGSPRGSSPRDSPRQTRR